MPRKILVVTGTRADYGLLRWLLTAINNSQELTLELLVTGMHLSEKFGNTWEAIQEDGFTIHHKVEMLAESDSSLDMAISTGVGLSSFARVIDQTKPDLTVVLGDRFEALAAAEASYLLGVPVAHIAGGEITEGALDDGMRHAITKLSSLHFVASNEYLERVIQLGEQPQYVHNVGAIGLDNFENINSQDREQLSNFLDFDLSNSEFALCTLHPETNSPLPADEFIFPLISALENFPELKVVITSANADAGGRKINEALKAFASSKPDSIRFFINLGQLGYISALKHASVVIGNSSSGILEAPSAGTPTVNIGDRQKGRMRAPSVIDVPNSASEISNALKTALSEGFQSLAEDKVSPFGAPGASEKIVRIIEKVDLSRLSPKKFIDISPRNQT